LILYHIASEKKKKKKKKKKMMMMNGQEIGKESEKKGPRKLQSGHED